MDSEIWESCGHLGDAKSGDSEGWGLEIMPRKEFKFPILAGD